MELLSEAGLVEYEDRKRAASAEAGDSDLDLEDR